MCGSCGRHTAGESPKARTFMAAMKDRDCVLRGLRTASCLALRMGEKARWVTQSEKLGSFFKTW